MSAWRPTSRVGLLVAFLLVSAVVGAIVQFSPGPAGAVEPPPNIVLILTDDQRADTLGYMPIVQRTLGKHGVTFTNAYVSNPVCCPSRATILTGLYSHSTGVYTNDLDGGFAAFDDSSTIATWLHDAGYHTGLFGKYLNGYESEYTPPGWDRWFATHESGDYYDYSATSDGTIVDFGDDPARLRDRRWSATRRSRSSATRPAEQPLFAYVSLPAPHEPAIPAPGDEDGFGKLEPWRPPSYNETGHEGQAAVHPGQPLDEGRPPSRDRPRPGHGAPDAPGGRSARRGRHRRAEARPDGSQNTIVVFTSDNGVLWGEHRWGAKDVPYEESHRGPADRPVRRPDLRAPGRMRTSSPTWTSHPRSPRLAGATTPSVEGAASSRCCSARPICGGTGFLMEHMASHGGNGVPSYCGFHTKRYVLVRYNGGDGELYDLRVDPWQRDNLYGSPAYSALQASLNERLVAACVPMPRGLVLGN